MNIGNIHGIKIKLHLSTLLIIGLIGFYSTSFYLTLILGATLLELVLVGLINSVIFLCSILIHELSHSIIAQKYGHNVSEIELYLFGAVSKLEEELQTPISEIIISIVGPLSSLIIGISLLALLFLPINLPNILIITFLYSGISNIGLCIFNLLPAFPFDGGRVLRALLWKRKNDLLAATKFASTVGVIFGYGLIFYGFFQVLNFGLLSGLWLIIIGSFLNSTAKKSYLEIKNEFILTHIKVKDIVNILNKGIPFNVPIDVAVEKFFNPYKTAYLPVIKEDNIIGIVFNTDIERIPEWKRAEMKINDIMRRLSEFPSIDEQQSGKEVFKKLYEDPLLLIVKGKNNEETLGFIGKNELLNSIESWSLNVDGT
ncbi:MAG: site-2 protease family protein [Promethearchaeota archaeon]